MVNPNYTKINAKIRLTARSVFKCRVETDQAPPWKWTDRIRYLWSIMMMTRINISYCLAMKNDRILQFQRIRISRASWRICSKQKVLISKVRQWCKSKPKITLSDLETIVIQEIIFWGWYQIFLTTALYFAFLIIITFSPKATYEQQLQFLLFLLELFVCNTCIFMSQCE